MIITKKRSFVYVRLWMTWLLIYSTSNYWVCTVSWILRVIEDKQMKGENNTFNDARFECEFSVEMLACKYQLCFKWGSRCCGDKLLYLFTVYYFNYFPTSPSLPQFWRSYMWYLFSHFHVIFQSQGLLAGAVWKYLVY